MARGEARPDSDVDVALLFTGPDLDGERPQQMAELSARLATIWQRPVDVVDLWPQSPINAHDKPDSLTIARAGTR
jgi:predicted nucleotidyltransferase